MALVHSYARFSSNKQSLGDSQKRQNESLKKFVKDGGHTLSNLSGDRTFDKGKSGFTGDKQKLLTELLNVMRAKDGRISPGDILFVEAIDRISRKDVRSTQAVINEIFKHGVHIYTVLPTPHLYRADDPNNLGDAMMLAAFAFQANAMAGNLSGRMRSAHKKQRELAAEGKPTKYKLPSWLKRTDDGGYIVDPEAKAAIQYVFRQTINGVSTKKLAQGMGAEKLAKDMETKFKPLGKTKGWTAAYIRRLLTGRAVLGEFQPRQTVDGRQVIRDQPIKDYWPRIIDDETYELAQAAVRNRQMETGRTTEYVNLFTGLTFHPVDKCSMTIHTHTNPKTREIDRRLRSMKSRSSDSAAKEMVILDDLEDVVLNHLRELDVSVFSTEEAKIVDQLGRCQTMLNSKKARLAEMQAAVKDNAKSLKVLLPAMTELGDEIDALVERMKALNATRVNSTQETLDVLRTTPNTNENRQLVREALKKLVERIDLLPIKLGPYRRSRTALVTEITFHNGKRRILWTFKKGVLSTFTIMKPKDKPLHERDDLGDYVAKAKKFFLKWIKPELIG